MAGVSFSRYSTRRLTAIEIMQVFWVVSLKMITTENTESFKMEVSGSIVGSVLGIRNNANARLWTTSPLGQRCQTGHFSPWVSAVGMSRCVAITWPILLKRPGIVFQSSISRCLSDRRAGVACGKTPPYNFSPPVFYFHDKNTPRCFPTQPVCYRYCDAKPDCQNYLQEHTFLPELHTSLWEQTVTGAQKLLDETQVFF